MKTSSKSQPSLAIEETIGVTVVIPIYNEEESLPLLAERLFPVLDKTGLTYEVVAVNDGSTDRSIHVLSDLVTKHKELRVIDLRRNTGQTAAIMAGIDHARGDVIVFMDSDLQNDPDDIPRLLAKLDEGFDVVSGWRKFRKDAAIRRNLPSRIANRLISRVSGVHLHDYGCTLKAYRKDVIKGVRLYGEMHRLIPIYASWWGARVTEIPVIHHARKFGVSKYGLERVLKLVLDLLVVTFLDRYLAKPIYVFGGFGIVSLMTSFVCLLALIYARVVHGVAMILTPLPLLSAMTFLIGAMAILMGLLAEIIVRTYFESRGGAAYLVRREISFEGRD